MTNVVNKSKGLHYRKATDLPGWTREPNNWERAIDNLYESALVPPPVCILTGNTFTITGLTDSDIIAAGDSCFDVAVLVSQQEELKSFISNLVISKMPKEEDFRNLSTLATDEEVSLKPVAYHELSFVFVEGENPGGLWWTHADNRVQHLYELGVASGLLEAVGDTIIGELPEKVRYVPSGFIETVGDTKATELPKAISYTKK